MKNLILQIREILLKSKFLSTIFRPIYRVLFSNYITKKKHNDYLNHSQEVLENTKNALESVEKFFWLEFGTLLGAIRDNDFIKHDTDLDIGMLYKDYDVSVVEAMERYGFVKEREFKVDDGDIKALEETYTYKGVCIDIFYFHIEDSTIFSHCFTKKNKLIIDSNYPILECSEDTWITLRMRMSFNGFTSLLFKDNEYNIPKDPELHLIEHYGSDYKTPRSWNYCNLVDDHKGVTISVNNVIIKSKSYV